MEVTPGMATGTVISLFRDFVARPESRLCCLEWGKKSSRGSLGVVVLYILMPMCKRVFLSSRFEYSMTTAAKNPTILCSQPGKTRESMNGCWAKHGDPIHYV